jgi:hypothetical protein
VDTPLSAVRDRRAPEAITDCEDIDFSPTEGLKPVLDHITGGG